MEIKLTQVMSLYESLDLLKDKSLPIKTSYKLNKLFISLHEQALFYKEKISEFIKEYAELDENGEPVIKENNNYFIPEENRSNYLAKTFELNNLSVEVADIKFTLDELDGIEIDMIIMNALMPFIEE